MKLPKQSLPVMRILPSVSYSNQVGVNPSMKLFDKIKELQRGSCSCQSTFETIEVFDNLVPARVGTLKLNNCKPGFSPKCEPNGDCTCENNRRGQVTINPTTAGILNIKDIP